MADARGNIVSVTCRDRAPGATWHDVNTACLYILDDGIASPHRRGRGRDSRRGAGLSIRRRGGGPLCVSVRLRCLRARSTGGECAVSREWVQYFYCIVSCWAIRSRHHGVRGDPKPRRWWLRATKRGHGRLRPDDRRGSLYALPDPSGYSRIRLLYSHSGTPARLHKGAHNRASASSRSHPSSVFACGLCQ